MSNTSEQDRFTPEACAAAMDLFWDQQRLAHEHGERKKLRRAKWRAFLRLAAKPPT